MKTRLLCDKIKEGGREESIFFFGEPDFYNQTARRRRKFVPLSELITARQLCALDAARVKDVKKLGNLGRKDRVFLTTAVARGRRCMRGGELETVVYLRNDRSNYFLPMLYDTFFLAKKELAWMGAWQRNRGTERGMRRTAERGGGGD